jgi:hypothetical protein
MIHWRPKRVINKWVDDMTLMGLTYIHPRECVGLVQKEFPISEDEVWDYFFQLVKDGQLIAVAGVHCNHDDEGIQSPSLLYTKNSTMDQNGNIIIDVQGVIDKTLTCPTCQNKIVADQKEIWIAFSPIEEYRKLLQEEKQKAKANRLSLIQ